VSLQGVFGFSQTWTTPLLHSLLHVLCFCFVSYCWSSQVMVYLWEHISCSCWCQNHTWSSLCKVTSQNSLFQEAVTVYWPNSLPQQMKCLCSGYIWLQNCKPCCFCGNLFCS
jgi:hypothetical protein